MLVVTRRSVKGGECAACGTKHENQPARRVRYLYMDHCPGCGPSDPAPITGTELGQDWEWAELDVEGEPVRVPLCRRTFSDCYRTFATMDLLSEIEPDGYCDVREKWWPGLLDRVFKWCIEDKPCAYIDVNERAL